MDKKLHDELIEDVEKLRSVIAVCSTQTVVGMVAVKFIRWPEEDIGLMSPHRQLFFLLGLMLSTNEPAFPQEFDDEKWNESVDLLGKIFLSYAWMFWPKPEEAGRLSQEWKEAREVAMPAFLHYFNSGLLASTEQIKDRIKKYIVPHDSAVKEIFGISTTEMLEITDIISKQMQADYDFLTDLKKKEENAHLAFLDEAERGNWDLQTMRRKAVQSPYAKIAKDFFSALGNISTVRHSCIQSKFGKEMTDKFLHEFSATRGSTNKLTYPTELNPAMETPLYYVEDDVLMIPSAHSIYLAILEKTERALLQSNAKETFLHQRDHTLENETTEVLRNYFGEKATILQSAYETDKQQYEHDIIVLWERKLFIVEAKAAPPREPLRDPDKAYVRIRDDFRSDRGIQKAYNQARRIEEIHEGSNVIYLYDNKGELVLEVQSDDIDRVYSGLPLKKWTHS